MQNILLRTIEGQIRNGILVNCPLRLQKVFTEDTIKFTDWKSSTSLNKNQ